MDTAPFSHKTRLYLDTQHLIEFRHVPYRGPIRNFSGYLRCAIPDEQERPTCILIPPRLLEKKKEKYPGLRVLGEVKK